MIIIEPYEAGGKFHADTTRTVRFTYQAHRPTVHYYNFFRKILYFVEFVSL